MINIKHSPRWSSGMGRPRPSSTLSGLARGIGGIMVSCWLDMCMMMVVVMISWGLGRLERLEEIPAGDNGWGGLTILTLAHSRSSGATRVTFRGIPTRARRSGPRKRCSSGSHISSSPTTGSSSYASSFNHLQKL